MIVILIAAIIFTLIMLIIKIDKYNSTGEVSEVSDIITLITAFVGIKSNGLIGAQVLSTGAEAATKEIEKNNKMVLYTHIFLHIAVMSLLTSFLCFLIEVPIIEEIAMVIFAITFLIGVLLPLIYGTKSHIKNKEDETNIQAEKIQNQKSNNVLVYDKKEYNRHVQQKQIIIIVILVMITIISYLNIDVDEYVGILNITPFIGFFAVILYTTYTIKNARKIKTLSITLKPLKVQISPPGEKNQYGNYYRKEETILFDRVTSYRVTNSNVIIYGDIKKYIHITDNTISKEKHQNQSIYKIPRVFNDMELLLNELNNIKNNNKNNY